MSDEFNPLKDIFSEDNINKFENDTIKFFSTVIRENEKNLERLQKAFSKKDDDDMPMPMKDKKVYYECPFPKPDNPLTVNDICPFPDNKPNINVDINNSEVDLLKSKKNDQPLKNDDNTSKDTKPLTDREVINKTSSMWKYNPILSSVEPFPEYITEKSSSPYAEILASRVRGKKHKHDGSNCDDNFSFKLVENCCIVSVSDGAGSKKFSRLGSKEVTTQYTKSMGEALESLLKDGSFMDGLSKPVTDSLFNTSCSRLAVEMQNAIKSSYDALVNKYEEVSKKWDYIKEVERDITLNDLSCTLLTAVIIPIETSNGVETFIATLQIGDGLICSINDSNTFDTCTKILGVSDSGAFSGETDFITTSNIIEPSNLLRRIKISKGKTSAIILATDGVADDYFPNNNKSAILYRDLQLNSIIPIDIKDDSSIKIVPPIREQKTIEENPKDISVAYSEDIQDFFNISDETLWKDTSFTRNAVSVYGQSFSSDRSVNLQNWLDNYTKRGSFDDRTLFIYRTLK
ncbi:MAG: PP2C family serine/threonine-protein phosphatase [Oscillospiraceae bacterium]